MIRLSDRLHKTDPLCISRGENPVLDEIDQTIVALLRENARRSFKDIGEHVHLSAPAVKRRVDRLEGEGVLLVPVPKKEDLAGLARGAKPEGYRDRADRV